MIGAKFFENIRANEDIGKAVMRVGSWGGKAKAEKALYHMKDPNAMQALLKPYAQRSIYNRGKRRIGYGAAGAGVLGINAMRSPNGSSSGAQGVAPQSSGGMTGAY